MDDLLRLVAIDVNRLVEELGEAIGQTGIWQLVQEPRGVVPIHGRGGAGRIRATAV